VVTHKGSHDSGHYECYRRQIFHPPPYSTPLNIKANGDLRGGVSGSSVSTPVSKPDALRMESPISPATPSTESKVDTPATPSTPAPLALSTNTDNLSPTTVGSPKTIDVPNREATPTTPVTPLKSPVKGTDTVSLKSVPSKSKKIKHVDPRWWRISDDSIKEVKTSDVMALQKEVYLLFYEKVRER